MEIGEHRPGLTAVRFEYGANWSRTRWADCCNLPLFNNKIDFL